MPMRSTSRTRMSWTLTLSPPSRSFARSISLRAAIFERRVAGDDIGRFRCRAPAPCRPSEQSSRTSPGMHLVVGDLDVHEQVVAQRAAEQVARVGFGGFARREGCPAALLGDHGVIARELLRRGRGGSGSSANRPRARPPRGRSAARRPRWWWPCASRRGWPLLPALVDFVLALCTRRGSSTVWASPRGAARKPASRVSTAVARSDFAAIVAADAVGQRRTASRGCGLRASVAGSDVAEVILVVVADAAHIGQLGELDIQHRSLRRHGPRLRPSCWQHLNMVPRGHTA